MSEEPESVPIHTDGEQSELTEAGWEPVERLDKLVWRHPKSGYFYPQGAAIQRLRMDRAIEEARASEQESDG